MNDCTHRTCEVLLAMQRELLYAVTPNLRAVRVEWGDDWLRGTAYVDAGAREDLLSEAHSASRRL